MSDGAETNGGSEGGLPEIELIIKASTIDGRRKGACLFCQVRQGEIILFGAYYKTGSLILLEAKSPSGRTNLDGSLIFFCRKSPLGQQLRRVTNQFLHALIEMY